MNIDHLIIAAVTVPAIALHLWLYLAIRRWMGQRSGAVLGGLGAVLGAAGLVLFGQLAA